MLPGCLIVEVHDHRSAPPPPTLTRPGLALSFQMNTSRDAPTASKAEVYRIVLAQNPATLWTEIGIMDKRSQAERGEEGDGAGLTEEEAVEIEAMILVSPGANPFRSDGREVLMSIPRSQARTVPPLCLSPSLQTTRIANSMLRATTLRPPKRKRERASGDAEDDEDGEEGGRREREEREKLMKIGDEGVGRGRGHACVLLPFLSFSVSSRSGLTFSWLQIRSTGFHPSVPRTIQPQPAHARSDSRPDSSSSCASSSDLLRHHPPSRWTVALLQRLHTRWTSWLPTQTIRH